MRSSWVTRVAKIPMHELESPSLRSRGSHHDSHSSDSLKEILEDLLFQLLHRGRGVLYTLLAVINAIGGKHLFFRSPKMSYGGTAIKPTKGKCWRDCCRDVVINFYFCSASLGRTASIADDSAKNEHSVENCCALLLLSRIQCARWNGRQPQMIILYPLWRGHLQMPEGGASAPMLQIA
jgi:hypothetical protein